MKHSTFFKCARLGAVSVFAMTLPWSCVGEEPQMNHAASASQALPARKPVVYALPTGADSAPQAPLAPKIAPKDHPLDGHSCAPRRFAECCWDDGFDDAPKMSNNCR